MGGIDEILKTKIKLHKLLISQPNDSLTNTDLDLIGVLSYDLVVEYGIIPSNDRESNNNKFGEHK